MKTNLFFTILFCMICMFISTSCEKNEIQRSTPSELTIQHRTPCPIEECTQCPVEDCCCYVELLSDPGVTPVTLNFCGTSSPCVSTMACSAGSVGTCPDIFGFVETITLINQGSRAGFCVAKNTTFGISSATGGSGPPQVRLTCQRGLTNPQTVTITLNTPPDKPYWSTNGDCELTSCF